MSEQPRQARVLVVAHGTSFTPALVASVRERAMRATARFRLVVPSPARGEPHLLHPERHPNAEEAEHDLLRVVPTLEAAAGGHVVASHSVRNNPMDAVEDHAHRLRHYGLPITTIGQMSP